MLKKSIYFISILAVFMLFSSYARAEVDGEVQYILNTFLFLVSGFLVMWMAAGFAMLESGLVTSKSVATIAAKNIGLYSIAGLMFWLVGYNMAYGIPAGGFIGSPLPWSDGSALDTGYSDGSDWFFQMVFCATTCSIVSGTLAERIKIWPFFIFCALLTGFIYPIEMGWQWGGGYLAEAGFSDFAGSTLVHSVGGWAALMGAIIIGPRLGKYSSNGSVIAIPGSNLPLATIGTFILWFGWFGFNGGSQLALGSAADAAAMANVYVNTNMAACGGLVAAMILASLLYGKVDLTLALNGALAGLVSITAGPDVATPLQAILIGAIGGILCTLAIPLLDKLKIDDVVGAISVHLVAGIWGTLVVGIPGLNGSGDFMTQLIGVVVIGVFVTVVSAIVWLVLKAVTGLRPSEEEEMTGLDVSELGMEAYPEFRN